MDYMYKELHVAYPLTIEVRCACALIEVACPLRTFASASVALGSLQPCQHRKT